MASKYSKYKVVAWSRLEGCDDKMTIYLEPFEVLGYINQMLDNCMVIKIDSGIKKTEEDSDDF